MVPARLTFVVCDKILDMFFGGFLMAVKFSQTK